MLPLPRSLQSQEKASYLRNETMFPEFSGIQNLQRTLEERMHINASVSLKDIQMLDTEHIIRSSHVCICIIIIIYFIHKCKNQTCQFTVSLLI
jgi:hypothetical protein